MADIYPLTVELNEKSIEKLASTYKFAQRQIENEILTASDFGVYNRQVILAQIDNILNVLADRTGVVLQKELPLYYQKGVKNADSQLNNIGADINTRGMFNSIHQEAIMALVDDTARAFAGAMTGVSRNARLILGKVVREEITRSMAKGLIAGEAMRDVKKSIKNIILEEGISALKDRGGNSWSLDRYSEMLFRTKIVEARNRGLVNRVVENGYDLVQVSDHMGECKLCRPWEGRILSVTGETKGYPTVSQAEANGLFHPNCKHAINILIPSLAKQTRAYYPEEKTRVLSKAEIEKASELDRPDLPRT